MTPLVLLLVAAAPKPAIPPDAKAAMDGLTVAKVKAHLTFLGDDLLEGRGTGTRGHELAAKYVASQLEAAGLEPAGTEGWFQPVKLRETVADPKACAVTLVKDGKRTPQVWGDDFIVRGRPAIEAAEVEAPVVFVGFGLTAPDRGWDDYAGVDVKGKLVATVYDVPTQFASEEAAARTSTEQVEANAAAHGAIGLIRLGTPALEKMLPWKRIVANAVFPAMTFFKADGSIAKSVPELKVSALLSPGLSARVFEKAPKSFEQALEGLKDKQPHSFELPVKLSIKSVAKHRDLTSPNVVGVLRGSDPKLKDEYVVYSSHLDHLGIGAPVDGDSIYNGVVDNASGSAVLVSLAQTFAAMPKKPKRSLLFVFTTAEEKGLLGADAFAEQPTVPAKSMVANINMDGASLFYPFDDVVALGEAHSSLHAQVAKAAAELGLTVSPDPQPDQAYFVRSDQFPFVLAGVPAVFASEGFKAKDKAFDARKFAEQWVSTRYHAPSDDLKQPLAWDAAVEYGQFHFLLGYHVAQDAARPTWNKGDYFGEHAPR